MPLGCNDCLVREFWRILKRGCEFRIQGCVHSSPDSHLAKRDIRLEAGTEVGLPDSTAASSKAPRHDRLESFSQHRPLLFGIAYRMLGSTADAEGSIARDIYSLAAGVGCRDRITESIPCDDFDPPLHQPSAVGARETRRILWPPNGTRRSRFRRG